MAIVNDAFVRQYFEGADALGRTVSMNDGQYTVVGVVGDIHFTGLDRAARRTSRANPAQALQSE